MGLVDFGNRGNQVNPVLTLTHNNCSLSRRCVDSIRALDVQTDLLVIDNGSTDDTDLWLIEDGIVNKFMLDANKGVSFGWNTGLFYWFKQRNADHVLVIGNDTCLASWTYSALLSANVPFVTGVDNDMNPLPEKPDVFPLSPHPDFSCFLIRREAWEKIGPFDERMVHYCSDCDYHIRAHRLGMPLWKASVPYQHERSSTLRNASGEDASEIKARANEDRRVFMSIYNCLPGDKAYEDLFQE